MHQIVYKVSQVAVWICAINHTLIAYPIREIFSLYSGSAGKLPLYIVGSVSRLGGRIRLSATVYELTVAFMHI